MSYKKVKKQKSTFEKEKKKRQGGKCLSNHNKFCSQYSSSNVKQNLLNHDNISGIARGNVIESIRTTMDMVG